jgi:hypothetical protein
MQDTNNFDPEKYEEFILEQAQLPKDDEHKLGTLIRRVKGGNENLIGKQTKSTLGHQDLRSRVLRRTRIRVRRKLNCGKPVCTDRRGGTSRSHAQRDR